MPQDKKTGKTLNDFLESDTLGVFGEKSSDYDFLRALKTNTTGGYYTPHITDDPYEHEGLFGQVVAPGDTTLYKGVSKSNNEQVARSNLMSAFRQLLGTGLDKYKDSGTGLSKTAKFEEVPFDGMTFSEAVENYKFKENPKPPVKTKRRRRR